jgi:hypothetical protein
LASQKTHYPLNDHGLGLIRATGCPGVLLFDKFLKKGVVKGVSGFFHEDIGEYRHSQKGKVPDAIKEFMSNEFIRVSQPILI